VGLGAKTAEIFRPEGEPDEALQRALWAAPQIIERHE
jgi:hypothetical protein